MPAAVVIPVKAFAAAKLRLAPALTPAERAALARSMAAQVVAAAAPLPVTVVCDDPAVVAWAGDRGVGVGVGVEWTPGLGLDGAVEAGVAAVGRAGARRAIVAHADLPLARDLAGLLSLGDEVVLVPDRHDDGTNVAVVPTAAGFRFAYGPASFARHLVEAERLGLGVAVVRDPRLGWDVDRPADLDLPTDAELLRASSPGRP